MHYPETRKKLMSLAVASACAASIAPCHGQEQSAATPAGSATGGEAITVVVTGLRASLGSSMNLKRNSDGIVDGIVAADIGKFPDSNLAEALQRISGVSIDRSIGEGSKVTVRGIGPDFNMVLLNGRQMATSKVLNRFDDPIGRAFDFANLASEAISQIQVYKTGRADSPTGGVGATLNVMTARPMDRPGTYSSVGAKLVNDTSNNHLPGDLKASRSVTPEVSGIYSTTFGGGMFGVAVSASYQARNLGFNQAAVTDGWRGPFRGDENNWGTIAQPGTPGAGMITNRPGPGDVYSVPQDLGYNMNGVQRKRTNGQLTLQFAPVRELVTTLDYTYSENRIHTKMASMSAWFNFGPSASVWTRGPVAAPLSYSEIIVPANSDIAMSDADFATKTENKAIGFNAAWKVSKDLKLEFDMHKSTAESMADSPFGSSNILGMASFSRGTSTGDFTHDFPVLSIDGADFNRAPPQVTGSSFRNGYMKGEVDQQQFMGRLRVMEASNLHFGISATRQDNRSAFSNQQRDTWGGATRPADYPSSVWHADTIRQYFKQVDGSDNPALFNQFFTFDFAEVRALAAKASGLPDLYLPKPGFDTDSRTEEKSKSAYLQFNTDWDTTLPMHTAIGVRFEKTGVRSTALVPAATSISWVSGNEFPVAFGAPTFTTLTGKYHNLLPSLDYDIDVRSDMKLRASYGETIGRPSYNQIQGGQTLDNLARVNGGTGAQGNPQLKPVKSKNLDLSLEWYYDKQSFASLGFFSKNLENFAGQSIINATPFNLHTPVGGPLWNEASAKGGCGVDTVCIRNYIFRNHNGEPGVVRGADDAVGNATGIITGQPGDPVASFAIRSFSNQKKADLHGAEINVQHMFGNSGFGVQANYTYVRAGIKYDNASIGEQFALVGLSNSANLVGIYEDAKWTVRAAYNWRGEFLSGSIDNAGPNPNYTEPYGQFDLSVGYAVTDRLSIQFEAINLTNEIQRIHGRTKEEVLVVNQSGPRYMLGARYKF